MRSKPERPEGFPLNPHRCGQWSKSVKGKDYYFGPWDDPDTALLRYFKLLDELGIRQPPKPRTTEPSVVDDASVVGKLPPPRVPKVETPEPGKKPDKPYVGFPLYSHRNGQ